MTFQFDSNGKTKIPVSVTDSSGSFVLLKPGIPSESFNYPISLSEAIAVSASFAIEPDPDDSDSIQFRIPSKSAGSTNDRIAFYVSGSGEIGVGTKDPESAFDVRDVKEDVDPKRRDLKTKIFKVTKTSQTFDTPVTASIVSASGTIIGSNLSGTNTGDQDLSNLVTNDQTASFAITGSDVIFNHITASENISGSLTGTISAGSGSYHILQGDTSQPTALSIDGHITASGNISASGNIIGDHFIGLNDVRLIENNSDTVTVGFQNNTPISIGKSANPTKFEGHITASGDVSSSGTVITSKLSGGTTGDQSGSLYLSGSLTFQSNEAIPAVSASTLYDQNGHLYYGGGLIGGYHLSASAGGNTPTIGYLKLMPHEALVNDDIPSSGGPIAEDNGYAVGVASSTQELYVYKDIPFGWAATAFRTFGSSTDAVRFYAYDITDTTANADGNTGTLNGAEVTLATPIVSTATNYVGIHVSMNSTADLFYGGYIKIEKQ